MRSTEQTIEFDKIKNIWKEYTLTDYAKTEIDEIKPIKEKKQLLSSLKETTEARKYLDLYGKAPLAVLDGMEKYVTDADEGACLTPDYLEEIALALAAVRRMKEYLKKGKEEGFSLIQYADNLNPVDTLEEEIHLQIRNGGVSDDASKLLLDLRIAIKKAEEKIRAKADSILRANKTIMSDNFSVSRNGHICLPVKKSYRGKIPGSVIDESATGSTLFIEPTAVAKLNDELQGLLIEADNEERRILYTLSAMVAEHAFVLIQNIRMLEKLDFIFSKGKLSQHFDAIEPKINTERRIKLVNGRHPLLDKSIAVPLQFEIGGDVQGIVITGPNTGGKTVCIKTVALNCMMAQSGLHIAAESADICMNSNYLCDIGDGQSLSENLSTFSAHITNVMDILHEVNEQSFVIMDELGSGTDPTEGMGIAVAILEELCKSGALFLVTTHYPEVKTYALKKDSIINARMTFDKESLKPTYQLVIGEAGESCAFHIARKLGMPEDMLSTAASAAYGDLI